MRKACYVDSEVYCDLHGGVEPEALPHESDSPLNCAACGCPVEYTLTGDGVTYVLDKIMEAYDDRKNWNKFYVHHGNRKHYYYGSRQVDVVRDWAADLQNYNLSEIERFVLARFLEDSSPPSKPAKRKRRTRGKR